LGGCINLYPGPKDQLTAEETQPPTTARTERSGQRAASHVPNSLQGSHVTHITGRSPRPRQHPTKVKAHCPPAPLDRRQCPPAPLQHHDVDTPRTDRTRRPLARVMAFASAAPGNAALSDTWQPHSRLGTTRLRSRPSHATAALHRAITRHALTSAPTVARMLFSSCCFRRALAIPTQHAPSASGAQL